jgi:hypothetical protein
VHGKPARPAATPSAASLGCLDAGNLITGAVSALCMASVSLNTSPIYVGENDLTTCMEFASDGG